MSASAFRNARDLLVSAREDYDRARSTFRWPQLNEFNWALDWFDAELANGPEGHSPALRIVGDHAVELTFKELSRRSNSVANGLRELGVGRGDKIMVLLDNCAALWEVMLAAMKLSAVAVPTTTLATARDIESRVDQAGIGYVVASGRLSASLTNLPASVTRVGTGTVPPDWTAYDRLLEGATEFQPDGPTLADDPILIYFTSGTTARPKLVVHSHRSYGAGSLSTMYWLGLRSGGMHLNVSSPGWAKHAWSNLFAPWAAGSCVFIYNRERFNAAALLSVLSEHPITSICAPPTVWRMLIQEDLCAYPVSLTDACSAGEPLNAEVIDAVRRAWGLTLRDGFGQTETTAQIANSPGQRVKPGAVGRPMPGYDVVLLNADGEEANEGEIALRLNPPPAGLMTGYVDAEGVLVRIEGTSYRTGDIATRDDDGWYTYLGRADDMFKASDYRISPFELESALIEHPLIVEAAVVPAPDALRQAVPKAFVTLVATSTADEEVAGDIFRHIAKVLEPYKRVRRIEFGELPKTISGKIRRVELRRLEMERFSNSERPPTEYREEDFAALG